jgi:RNA polymerase sigma factor (sigma-70 family)
MASAAPDIPVLTRDHAFENLYRQYVGDVYHYVLALLRNPADAEDVTQTTFMNAYRAFKRGEEIHKPQNWLIKIAHNVARSRYARASRRVKEVPLEDHVEQLSVPEAERPDIEGVLRALGRLPFNQRAALVMRELDGRTYAEIADTLDVSVSAVETLIFRARKSLRLRASALRVLGTVPVPSSLAQFFQGGAVVAGGGAATGLVAKAVVALVIGTAATGLSGDDGKLAVAAAKPSASPTVGSGDLARTDTQRLTGAAPAVVRGAKSARKAVAVRPDAVATRVARAPLSGRAAAKGTTVAGPAQEGAAKTGVSVPTVPAPVTVAPVTEAAAGLVEVVEQVAAAPTPPPLPVSIPSPPPLPVEIPPPPPLP